MSIVSRLRNSGVNNTTFIVTGNTKVSSGVSSRKKWVAKEITGMFGNCTFQTEVQGQLFKTKVVESNRDQPSCVSAAMCGGLSGEVQKF